MSDEDAQYEEDEEMNAYPPGRSGAALNGRSYDERSTSDLLLATPPALRDSRIGLGSMKDSFSAPPKASIYGKIAKNIYAQMDTPTIQESDDLILGTETIIGRLYEEGIGTTEDEEQLRQALVNIPGELTKLWTGYQKATQAYDSEEYTTAIGPGSKASNFEKANFLACLALQIHHPQPIDPTAFTPKVKPLPQIMLEWIDEHHNPYLYQFEEVYAHRPSPANHRSFWDTILNGVLRGKVIAVANILKNAGWKYAWTGMDGTRDQGNQVGYSGPALANVERAVGAAHQILSQCPAVSGDWNIRGGEWTVFRLKVAQALEDLKSFAEGGDRGRHEPEAIEADSFGNLSQAGRPGTYAKAAKKAESQLPWDVYQNLVTLYNLVMGESNAIIENAQDWCEAAVGLLVWWDEDKEDRRLALGRSQANRRSASRGSDAEIYLRKLRRSFETATAGSTDFQVNTLNPIEVGLASLLEGDSEAVVGFLRAWSGPVSSAVAEVASLAHWLPQGDPQGLISMDNLDQDDMDLLGINPPPANSDGVKDQTLITYAKSLAQRGQLTSAGVTREGWELSIAVLGRLDSTSRSEEIVGDFVKGLPLDSSAAVDKLWRLLNDIGMTGHAEDTAEVSPPHVCKSYTDCLQSYANQLAEGSHNYGEALWYYALSHKTEKVKDVLDLLISLSLVQSIAYPPESELDNYLKRLTTSPQDTLSEISRMDLEAAELLHRMLSGYATLRRFYTLRDDEVQAPKRGKYRTGALARKREAASALLAVIMSSDDNIRGGLYDEERGAVVSVDFLLALLGEAMVFVNQPDMGLTAPQIDILLKAIEDLQTVSSRVRSACDEFLQTVIASGQGLKGSTPTDMLRKSTSNTSGTSSFSLVGSSMLASQLKQSMGSSGVLVKGNIKRGWDWRQGISAGTSTEDVLRILRLGLAKDLAKAWLVEVDSGM
jgi:hypothetical protein